MNPRIKRRLKIGGFLAGKDKQGKNVKFSHSKRGGIAVGAKHGPEGGIEGVVGTQKKPIEFEGEEIVITAPAVKDNTRREFEGQMLTNREILSRINESGGGVSFADGGEVPNRIRCSGKEYKYGGKMVRDYDIITSSCGCKHSLRKGGQTFRYFDTEFDIDKAYKMIKSGTIIFDVKEVPVYNVRHPLFNKEYSDKLKPDFKVAQGLMIKLPTGEDFLIDGNHRMAKAHSLGRKKMKVYYISNPKTIKKFSKKSFADGGKISDSPRELGLVFKKIQAIVWKYFPSAEWDELEGRFTFVTEPNKNNKSDQPEILKQCQSEIEENYYLYVASVGWDNKGSCNIYLRSKIYLDNGSQTSDDYQQLVEDFKKVKVTKGSMLETTKNKPEDMILFIQEQATGFHITSGRFAFHPAYKAAVDMVGKDLTDRAIALLPQETKDILLKKWKGKVLPAGLREAVRGNKMESGGTITPVKKLTWEEFTKKYPELYGYKNNGKQEWQLPINYKGGYKTYYSNSISAHGAGRDIYKQYVDDTTIDFEKGGKVKPYPTFHDDTLNIVTEQGTLFTQAENQRSNTQVSKSGELSTSELVKNRVPEIELTFKKVEGSNTIKLNSSKLIFDFLMSVWDKKSLNIQETFYVIYLNRANDIIGYQELSKGGITATVADPELVLATAAKALAKNVVIAHNHPSGSLQPSRADEQVTQKIGAALKLIDIQLVDHLIISPNNGYYSFTDEGILNYEKGGELKINGIDNDLASGSFLDGRGRDYRLLQSTTDFQTKIFANGGDTETRYQIKNTEGGYYSRQLPTGRIQWIKNPELGYLHTDEEAQDVKEFLEKEGYKGVKIVPYVAHKEHAYFAKGGDASNIEKPTINLPTSYPNAYELNKAIEKLLDSKKDDMAFTADEKTFIRYYSGYGGLEKYGADGKGLLYEYYTPTLIAEKMWGLAYKHGFTGGAVIEPAAGIGEFIKYAPDESQVTAYEINPYSARICKILYPKIKVESKYFEELFIINRDTIKGKIQNLKKYDLVIGNPPYGEFGGKFAGMGEKNYTRAGNYIDYFIFRGLDLLKPGGLLIFIVGAEVAAGGKCFLSQQMNKCKDEIMEKSELLDAYRLPNGVFERTDVLTDIIVLRKK